ncbi:DM13 domain-containing protein [Allokutzneria sp. A3M-2-11 16]|uniref:DM13 domain-containing protein n=1 Tax=Allokutzneria sp. A3M-2-11 16 TaxID=2962043 RepID=UPI0020B64980|nr:DM13 domain-containing protein [Allokutzneria sp. A3M-2-11 16]MCP3802806.1 DM13 domain-containing protein [Allokutzneria sp. A3M-2-11 16]
MRQLLRKRWVQAGLAVGVVVLVVGLWLFQPWRLFTSSTIDEALPMAPVASAPPTPTSTTAPTSTASSSSTVPSPSTAPSTSAAPPSQPKPTTVELASGAFVTQEHKTTGTAKVLTLADGNRVLRLEGLATSDGPDLHVWLTDATAGGSWGKYDDGRSVKLGALKATHGNQNYAIPAKAELGGLRSVVIWCDRFNVAFGSAPLSL